MRSGSLLHVATLAARLEDLLGVGRVSMRPQVSIHGLRPRAEVEPADTQQLAAVLSMANDEGLGVCVAAGGTKLGWGNSPERLDVLVATGRMPAYCEVDADDLVLTAGASTTVAEARRAARAQRRVLPFDAEQPAAATIGGVIATADQGPRGGGYGGVRDVVLGVRVVLVDGSQVQFGGRTMKNVAGYDMTKLFVGSLGELGVLTEATLRLLPQPDSQALMLLPMHSLEQAQGVATLILDEGLQPFVLELLSGQAVAEAGPGLTGPAGTLAEPGWLAAGSGIDGQPGWLLLLAGFWGHEAAVDRSVRQVRDQSGIGEGIVLRDEQAEAALDALSGMAPRVSLTDFTVAARASVPMSEVWDLTEYAFRLATAGQLVASYRVGVARGVLSIRADAETALSASHSRGSDEAATSSVPLATWLEKVRAEAVKRGGQLIVTRGLELLGPGFDAWGHPASTLELMKRIKQRFDPRGTLNAGRLIGAR